MVVQHSPAGLIAATRGESTRALNELVVYCGWPLLLQANPRRLQRELSLHDPECVLFWLDDPSAVASTAQLVAWSRQRGARPLRVAVAFELAEDVESVLRAAGAHSFFPIVGHSVALIADAIEAQLSRSASSVSRAKANNSPRVPSNEHVGAIEFPSDLVRPP